MPNALPLGRVPATSLCLVLAPAWFALAGCYALVPPAEGPASVGHPSSGVLVEGRALADRGPGFVRARPGEDTRWGTPSLVGALERAAASVATALPGTAPLRIGDLSGRGGGRHERHRSHRTGRDADIIFYATDASGRSVQGRGWLAFDRFGVARETGVPGAPSAGADGGVAEGPAPSNAIYFLDEARNWHFVRTLLADEQVPVQWIFCSRGVKARLLAYAAEHEPDPAILVRATHVLHQPQRARPHDDHFHVRIACSAAERAAGCRDTGPIWPWIRRALEKPSIDAGPALSDEALVAALVDDASSDAVASAEPVGPSTFAQNP